MQYVNGYIKTMKKIPPRCEKYKGKKPRDPQHIGNSHFYDKRLMDYLSCYPRYMATSNKSPVLGKVLAEGKYGIAQEWGNYVVKVSKIDPDELRNEFVIGDVLNSLSVPNFVQTYSLIQADGEEYLVVDYIRNAATLHHALKHNTLSASDLLSVILQVFYSLWIAFDKYKYIHHDLHSDNILLTKVQKPVQIPYLLPNGAIMMVTTRYVVRIIDFGMSNLSIQGSRIGDNESYSTKRGELLTTAKKYMYQDQDLFKFFFNVLNSLKSNSSLMPTLSVLLDGMPSMNRFFTKRKLRRDIMDDYLREETYGIIKVNMASKTNFTFATFNKHVNWFLFDYLHVDYVSQTTKGNLLTCDSRLIEALHKEGQKFTTECYRDTKEMDKAIPYV